MILDALHLPSHDEEIETDLCIVGSGPAALAVALEASAVGSQLVLLESGGLECEPGCQEANAGEVVGSAYSDLRDVRRRQIGGTVNTWNTDVDGAAGAKYAPLDPIDFERREWVPHSGWPFGAADLGPWYAKAQKTCGLGAFAYDAAAWVSDGARPFALDDAIVATSVYQFGFAAGLLDGPIAHLRTSDRVRTICHATVVELVTDRHAGHVEAVVAAVPRKAARLRVRAKRFVLAAGAIENARLLLASNAVRSEGLGNAHDLVGRFFMEHPRDYALTLRPARPNFLEDAGFYDRHLAPDGTLVMGRLAIAAAELRARGALQASATLLPAVGAPGLWTRIRRRVVGNEGPRDKNYPQGAAGWSRGGGASVNRGRIRLLLNLEQSPSPENRVVLDARRDGFGTPRVQVHWRWTDNEQRALQATRQRFARALESAGYGAVEIKDEQRPDPNAHHHAGTTRMHEDARFGVVDPDSRVHGIDNLYVAGGSVFPTAGFANPTLTIVALALRLGEHLRKTES